MTTTLADRIAAELNADRKNNIRVLFSACPEDGHIHPLPNRAERRAAARRARRVSKATRS